jgi:hypothetical protein
MRVLIYAIDFAPKIGGEETCLLLLGLGLAHRLNRAKKADTKGEQWRLIVGTKTSAKGISRRAQGLPA